MNKIKIKSVFTVALLAFSLLVLPVSASENSTQYISILQSWNDFFANLPHITSTDIDRMTEVVTVIKQNPISNTTSTHITEVSKTVMNNTTITQITKVVDVMKNNPPNNTTMDNLAKSIQLINSLKRNDLKWNEL